MGTPDRPYSSLDCPRKLTLRVCFALLMALLLASAVNAAVSDSGFFSDSRSDNDNLAQFNGWIIDTVIIDNRNIYDTNTREYDKFLFRFINSVHIKTRARIVAQENLLRIGGPFSALLAEETARNLRLRLTLYDSWVQVEPVGDHRVSVRIVTIDQWSLAAGLDIGRDGNEERYNLGVTERNVLGLGQYFSFDYTFQSIEDDILLLTYTEPRILGKKLYGSVNYFDGPGATGELVTIGRPYYDRLQSTAYDLTLRFAKGRRDIYEDTVRVARSNYDGETVTASTTYRWGGYHKKWQTEFIYQYRFERTDRKETIFEPSGPLQFPDDSLAHDLGLSVGWSDVDFIKTRRVDGFGYTEDFVLGFGSAAQFNRAFAPSFDQYVYDQALFDVNYAFHWGRSLVLNHYQRSYWYRGSSEFRTSAEWVSRIYNRLTSYLTIVGRLRYLSDWRSDASNNLVLGGETGVRGLNTYTRTGDRLVTATLESRLFSGIELLSIGIGAAAFVDAGRVWKARAPVHFRDFLFAGGIGLRLEAARSSRTRLIRIDLAYSDQTGWQLSLGTGQYFPASNLSFP